MTADPPGADRPATPRRATGFGRVELQRAIPFEWNGRPLVGAAGDTLASALMANGVAVTGRSPVFGRSRGLGSCGPAASGGLARGARSGGAPRLADPALIELEPGISAALPTKLDRRQGGAASTATPDEDIAFAFCDALVVGAGPAGIEAARVLAEAGQDALLVDRDFVLGGGLLGDPVEIDGSAAADWLAARRSALGHAGARIQLRTAFLGLFDHGGALLGERLGAADKAKGAPARRLWRVRFEALILATGGVESRGRFADNDLPGVATAGALRSALLRFGVLSGSRIVIATANESG